MQYRRFRIELAVGLLIVMVVGFIMHYVYEWSGNSFLVGLFVPVSESAWEHMKLVYLPLLLLSVFIMTRWGNELPPATTGMLLGIMAGTWLIPILFYTYRGIVGYGIPAVDMATFFASVIICGFAIMHLVKRCQDDALPILKFVLGVLVIVQGVLFLWFTYHPPGIGLFAAP